MTDYVTRGSTFFALGGALAVNRSDNRRNKKNKAHPQLVIEYFLIAVLFGATGVVLASTMRHGILTSLSNLTSSVEQTKDLEPEASAAQRDAEPKPLELGINAIQ